MNVDVSIVLATVNRANLLKNMLDSLKEAIGNLSYELIIVEGDSSDNTSEVIDKFSPIKPQVYNEVEYLGTEWHSWAKLYNFGFSKAIGKWAIFASDDITFNKGCFSNAVLELNSQKDDIAGGIFFYKNTPPVIEFDGDFHINYVFGQKLFLNFGLIRLDYFKEVGGFSEEYDFYYGDTDLNLKLYKSGRTLIPLSKCFVQHFSIRNDPTRFTHVKSSASDGKKFRDKWRGFIEVDHYKQNLLFPVSFENIDF